MNLENFKSSWKHLKAVNDLSPLDNRKVLLLIEEVDERKTHRFQQLLINLAMFLLLTFMIQGG